MRLRGSARWCWSLASILVYTGWQASGRADEPGERASSLAEPSAEAQEAPGPARERVVARACPLRAGGDPRGEAGCLALTGLLALSVGQREYGLTLLREGSDLLVAAGDLLGGAAAALIVGLSEAAGGLPKEGEDSLRQALVYLAALDPEGLADPGPVAPALLALPLAATGIERPPDLGAEGLLHLAEGLARSILGEVLAAGGRPDEAEPELLRAAELSAGFGGLLDVQIFSRLGDVYAAQQEPDRAQQSYRHAEAALERRTATGPAQSLSQLLEQRLWVLERQVEVAAAQGQMDEALRINDRALALLGSGSNPIREVLTLRQRALLLRDLGNPGAAREVAAGTRGLALKVEDPETRARTLAVAGIALMETGADEAAAACVGEAASLLDDLELEGPQRLSRDLLAMILDRLDASERALRELDRGQTLGGEIPIDVSAQFREEVVEALLQHDLSEIDAQALADRLRQLRQTAPAAGVDPTILDPLLQLLESGLEAFKAGDLTAVAAGIRRLAEQVGEDPEGGQSSAMLRAMELMAEFRWREADRELRRAEELAARRGAWREQVSALQGLSLLAQATGRPEVAIASSQKVIDLLEGRQSSLVVDEFHLVFAGAHQTDYQRLIDLLVRAGRGEEAFQVAERARARSLLRLLGNQRLNLAQGADPDLLQETQQLRDAVRALEERLDRASGSERDRLRGDLEAARSEYDNRLLRLRLSDPGVADLLEIEPISLPDLRRHLPPETSLVSYFLLPDQALAWVVDRQGFELVELPLGEEERRLVRRFRQQIAGGRAFVPALSGSPRGARPVVGHSAPRRLGEALYEVLFAPLVPHLRHRRLVLIPHGELHFLPFPALREPADGHYLIESYVLSYAPSASALGQLDERLKASTAATALVLGEPATDDDALSTLAGARSEAETVAELLGVEPLLGGTASETSLRRLAPTASLVHLAAHGVLHPADPRFSYIALAPGGGQDGRLEMTEVFEELDLGEARLVVLSACQTALGERSGGDEVVGLVRAFLYAGATSVLATLWEVDDVASAELMESFYRRLLAGESASEALAAAQVELLRRPGTEAPYYWAGYTLIGEARLAPSAQAGASPQARHPRP